MIVCDINLFSMNQEVFEADENGMTTNIGKCTIEDLPRMLVQSCYKYKANTIRLYGNEHFIEELIPSIQEINSLNYSNRIEIKVEVG